MSSFDKLNPEDRQFLEKNRKAREPECACVCGGANHGAGLEKAMENTQQMAEGWLERYARENDLEDWWSEVLTRSPVQLSLFDLEGVFPERG